MTLDISVGTPLTLVYSGGPTPVLATGRVTRTAENLVEIELASDVVFPAGVPLMIFPAGGVPASRLMARLYTIQGRCLQAQDVRVPVPDKREYPRLQGVVGLRYRKAGAEDPEAWLRGEMDLPLDRTPDSFANFSVTGLSFDDEPGLAEGEAVLMTLSIPGDDREWRCAVRVVRVIPIPPDQLNPNEPWTQNVAISFEKIPPGATMALADYTLRIQDVFLEGTDAARRKPPTGSP